MFPKPFLVLTPKILGFWKVAGTAQRASQNGRLVTARAAGLEDGNECSVAFPCAIQ